MEITSLNGNGSIYKDGEMVSVQGYGDGWSVDCSTNLLLSENVQTVIYFLSKDTIKLPPIPEEFLFIPAQATEAPVTTPQFSDPSQVTFKYALSDTVNLVATDTINQTVLNGWTITSAYVSIKDNYFIPSYSLELDISGTIQTVLGIEEALIYQ